VTKRIAAALLTAAIALPLYADFGAIARAIDSQHGVKRVWIPFLGVARVAIWMVRPQGVHDFQLATFEGGDVDPKWMHAMLRENIDKGFTPLVQVWSRKSGEWSFIYARPHANDRIELMVLTHDSSDTVLVRVEVDADVVAREIADRPREVSRVARR
jgi:hypothetical protein